jgi:hypothetical protein
MCIKILLVLLYTVHSRSSHISSKLRRPDIDCAHQYMLHPFDRHLIFGHSVTKRCITRNEPSIRWRMNLQHSKFITFDVQFRTKGQLQRAVQGVVLSNGCEILGMPTLASVYTPKMVSPCGSWGWCYPHLLPIS